MHFTLTAGNVILGPTAPGGAFGPIWSLVIGIVLWATVAVLTKRGAFAARSTK